MYILEKMFTVSTLLAFILVGCGNSSSQKETKKLQMTEEINNNDEDSESYTPYLKEHHANYSQDGNSMTPSPTKDVNAKSIDWTIRASSNEGAENLVKHLHFMINKLENNGNPRPFDKLFLMEAYMKYNHYYITTVEQSATSVVVSKQAITDCAYKVIAAHSDVVSGDFFAQGDIKNDYSLKAETILVSSACDDVRTSVEAYISQR